jgi:hypothetical protein
MVKVPFNEIRSVRIIGNITDNPELLKVEWYYDIKNNEL